MGFPEIDISARVQPKLPIITMNEVEVVKRTLSETPLSNVIFPIILDYLYYDFSGLEPIFSRVTSSFFFPEKVKRVLLYLGTPEPEKIQIGYDNEDNMLCVLTYRGMSYPKHIYYEKETVVTLWFKMLHGIVMNVEINGPMRLTACLGYNEQIPLELRVFFNRFKECITSFETLKKSVRSDFLNFKDE